MDTQVLLSNLGARAADVPSVDASPLEWADFFEERGDEFARIACMDRALAPQAAGLAGHAYRRAAQFREEAYR